MRTEGKISKVAICKVCKKTIKAMHVDYITKHCEKEFTDLTNEGFIVKLETGNATRKREFGFYGDCHKKQCLTENNNA